MNPSRPRLPRPQLIRFAVLVAAVTLTAALLVAGCGGSDDDQWKDETISIGSLFSTTGDGVPFGPQQVKGAQLAVDEINDDDDGINGAELTLTQRDDASDPATSAKEMKSLIGEQQVMAVLGPTFSNSAAEADPVANQEQTPVLAVSNTGPGIVGDCDYPCDFIFRDSLGEATAIPANVKNLVAGNKPTRALVLYAPDDDFGKTSAQTAAKAFQEAGVRTVSGETGRLKNLLGTKPGVVMITASSGETGSEVVQKLRGEGYRGPIGGGNAFNSPLVAKSLGKVGKGVQSASAWYAGNASEENQEFIASYQSKYGEAPDQFAAQAYTGVKLLAEAAEDADLGFDDLAADRKALKASLEKVSEETPLGQFSFTPDHDVNQPIWIVAMDGKGGYTLVEKVNP
ncbi:MAG: ABC transporter substrate-binding protein [Solirubrobacterales bacterium]|nr:ABC transporter substrate-binding protein [Solirubrobacterales bacterium]OJU93900.1 MAG: hypothetical protein BGO23_14970 [Solirubrobacterales bacterium 67-14]